jgi:mycofactocin precursor
MDQDITAHDVDIADDTATVAVDAPEADELLIEEISIDGMCGVY